MSITSSPTETVAIPRLALDRLVHLKDEFDTLIESLELASDPEVMAGLAESRRQFEAGKSRPIEELDLDDL